MWVLGMMYMCMLMFIWMIFVIFLFILFVFLLLIVGLGFLMLDCLFGISFFNLVLGGNIIIWEYLFWIFGYLEVYIFIFLVFGIFLEIFVIFLKK